MELIKRAKRLYKALLVGNKERKGFTLPEVAAVVAITGTLAAIVVPVSIDQIEKGRQARAAMDVDGISQAISGFFRDTGEWPDRTSGDPNGVEVLRSGGTDATWDFSADNLTEGNVDDPAAATGLGWGTGTADALVNHLTLDSAGYVEADVNWNGPYMPQVFNDPWGRNYLVYAKAFTDVDAGFVWVISAGPNETLETSVTSPILNDQGSDASSTTLGLSTSSDDIGKMMFKARDSVLGVSG